LLRSATLLFLVLAAGLSFVLFQVKYEVQKVDAELNALHRQIAADRQAIHVLKAEWTHLNDPARLRELAARHLAGLKPMAPGQFAALADLPARAAPQSTVPDGPAALPAVLDGGSLAR
jgi:cell division protein FtsL